MSVLLREPLSSLLPTLHAQAVASNEALRAELAARSPEERAAMFASARTDYRAFYGTFAKDLFLAVSEETGALLYMLARASRARSVVEFGTSFGVSTIHLAAAVRDSGGGRVIGTEFEPDKAASARENIARAGLADLVEVREGDALDSLARDLPETIDFVLLDGAKSLYPSVLALLEPRLARGALVVADNADASPELRAYVRARDSGYLSAPCGEELELSIRL